MEYMDPNLMSREELIRILEERHLKIPDIVSFETKEIIRIFTKFVVPLNSRNEAVKPIEYTVAINNTMDKVENGNHRKMISLKRNACNVDSLLENPNSKHMKINGINGIVSKSPSAQPQKRHQEAFCESNSTKTKRQKITWP